MSSIWIVFYTSDKSKNVLFGLGLVPKLYVILSSAKFVRVCAQHYANLSLAVPNKRCLDFPGIPCGSVVICLTHNPGVLGSSHTGSSVFFVEVSLGKTLQSPSLVLLKPREDMNNVSCCHGMTEKMLKAAQNTIQSIIRLS